MIHLFQKYIESRKKWLGFNDVWLILLGTPPVGFIMSYMFYEEFTAMNAGVLSRLDCFWIGMLYTLVYWIAFTEWAIFMHKRYPALSENVKRIIITSGGIVVLYFVLDHFVIRGLRSYFLDVPFAQTAVKETEPTI